MDFLGGLAQGKPDIPQFNAINLGDEQTKATNNNLAALPGIESLASQTNSFNLDQVQKMLRSSIPGYDQMVSGISGNINSQIHGEIPKDVQDAIQTSAAAKSLTGGFGGTGMAGNLVARDLGLTSLNLTQQGQSSAESWFSNMSRMLQPGQFNVSSMFLTPEQQFSADTSERDKQFQHDYVSNMNDWQHSLGFLWGQDMENTGNTIGSLLSSFLGGKMGGGGGGGGNGASG